MIRFPASDGPGRRCPMRCLLFAATALLVLTGRLRAAPEAPATKGSAAFAVEIRIAPKEGAPGQFFCEATVTDLGTGKVIARPRVEFLQGKSGTAITDDETGKREILLTAGVEGNATRASYTVEVREGETLVSSQKGSVKLR